MGIFDLFGKNEKVESERSSRLVFDERLSPREDRNAPVSVFSPQSYQEVETIIDAIKAGKNTMVHLNELKNETAIRVLDILSGAIYALGGGVYEMGNNVFMFSPAGVEVNV